MSVHRLTPLLDTQPFRNFVLLKATERLNETEPKEAKLCVQFINAYKPRDSHYWRIEYELFMQNEDGSQGEIVSKDVMFISYTLLHSRYRREYCGHQETRS